MNLVNIVNVYLGQPYPGTVENTALPCGPIPSRSRLSHLGIGLKKGSVELLNKHECQQLSIFYEASSIVVTVYNESGVCVLFSALIAYK